jgi:hypothetical protein
MDKYVNTVKTTETVTYAKKEVCFEVNTKRTKYMFMPCHQNVGQNHDRYLKNSLILWQSFVYLRMIVK